MKENPLTMGKVKNNLNFLYKDLVITSHRTKRLKNNWLSLHWEVIAVCCENYTERLDTGCGQNADSLARLNIYVF